MLHKKCSTPLNYERRCSTCNVTVPWEDIVHGYEYEKDKFVVIKDEELERIPATTSKSIDILRFFDLREIKPIYFDKSYYLEPTEGGERASALLREVIKDSGKVALAKITFKDKEHVGIIRVFHDALLLCTLYYADEIIKSEALNIPGKIELDPKELDLAKETRKTFSRKA
jgi:DNA end-binding protein Ku